MKRCRKTAVSRARPATRPNGLTRLREPPDVFAIDPEENRRSTRKLADLNPAVNLSGHGPAATDAIAFDRFVKALPR